jgi:hypothetical protein
MGAAARRKREARRQSYREPLGIGRLADRLWTTPWHYPAWLEGHDDLIRQAAERSEELKREISLAPVIAIDDVSEVFYADNPKEEWDYTQDFPSFAPPFPEFFIESRRPSRLNSEGVIKDASSIPPLWGWYFTTTSRADMVALLDDPEGRQARVAAMMEQVRHLSAMADFALIERAKASGDPEAIYTMLGDAERTLVLYGTQALLLRDGCPGEEMIPEDYGWSFDAQIVLYSPEQNCLFAPATCSLAADRDGMIRSTPITGVVGGHLPEFAPIAAEYHQAMRVLMFPAAFAISLMNCKNVTIQPVDVPPEVRRDRKKQGKRPLVRYHVLDIEPMRKVLRSEGQSDSVGLRRALHVCRGHFATYSEDRPLFGRPGLHGRFWMPAHVRGSAREGVVAKDYRVLAPKGGEGQP